MPQAQIAKAVLIPMNGDQVETDVARHIVVQFNPATLRVTLSNTLRADTNGGGHAAAQYVDKSESSLAVELLFDTTVAHVEQVIGEGGAVQRETAVAANSDVRKLTQRIAEAFMKPQNPESGRPGAPQRCRFQWGSFQFTGMLSSYSETLDFFAPEGIPLRATLALSFKEDRYQFDLDESVGAAARQSPTFAPGGAGISADRAAQAAGGNPRDWRVLASFNGLENPRFTPAGGLSLPTPEMKVSAGSGIAVLAGAEISLTTRRR
jgi:hypothetical protein